MANDTPHVESQNPLTESDFAHLEGRVDTFISSHNRSFAKQVSAELKAAFERTGSNLERLVSIARDFLAGCERLSYNQPLENPAEGKVDVSEAYRELAQQVLSYQRIQGAQREIKGEFDGAIGNL